MRQDAAFEDVFLGLMGARVTDDSDGGELNTAAGVNDRIHIKEFGGQGFGVLDSFYADAP